MLFRPVSKPPAWPPPVRADDIAATFDYARARDPVGNVCHHVFAMLFVACISMQTAPKDVALIILGIYALMRIHCTWRCYTCLLRDPIAWCMAAWIGWHTLSMLWTPDIVAAKNELRTSRFALSILALWPIVRSQQMLIGALLAGVLVMNIRQLMQKAGIFGHELDFGRADGLIHPIHAGSLCASAGLWHAAAVFGRGSPKERLMVRLGSLGLLAVAFACLGLTGSRGPMLAFAPVLMLFVVTAMVRRPHAARSLAIAGIAGVIGVAITWSLAGDVVMKRWNEGIADIERFRTGDIESDVGMRLALWQAGWEAFTDAPIRGVGAGGMAGVISTESYGPSSDAHSMYVHELATGGLVSAALLAYILTGSIIRSWRADRTRLWSAATPFVLLAWLGAAAFDTYQLSGHMFALLTFILAITHPYVQPPPETVEIEGSV